MNDAKPTEKAGATIYKAMLSHYQMMREGAERDMNRAACTYADSKKPEDHSIYLSARSRINAWDEAIRVLTSNGGDLMRLDFQKS